MAINPFAKTSVSFRIQRSLWLTFKSRCRRRGKNASLVLRKLITEWLKTERGTKQAVMKIDGVPIKPGHPDFNFDPNKEDD